MNVACDDVLLQPNEESSSYLKNEKYYSFNNIRRKSLKNSEQEEKCLNRIKRFISIKIIIINIIVIIEINTIINKSIIIIKNK